MNTQAICSSEIFVFAVRAIVCHNQTTLIFAASWDQSLVASSTPNVKDRLYCRDPTYLKVANRVCTMPRSEGTHLTRCISLGYVWSTDIIYHISASTHVHNKYLYVSLHVLAGRRHYEQNIAAQKSVHMFVLQYLILKHSSRKHRPSVHTANISSLLWLYGLGFRQSPVETVKEFIVVTCNHVTQLRYVILVICNHVT